MKKTQIFLLLSLFSIFVACQPQGITTKKTTASNIRTANQCIQTSISDIYGGCKALLGQWESTVALTTPRVSDGKSVQFCTGVLIARNIVITAAHCVSNAELPTINEYPSKVKVYIGNGVVGSLYSGQFVIKSVGFDLNWGNPNPDHDFGYLILEDAALTSPLTANIRIIPPISDTEATNYFRSPAGKSVTLVGFGEINNGTSGVKYDVVTKIDSVSSTEITIGGGGQDTCYGDSGGPVYARLVEGDDTSLRIIGITSRGGTCGSGGTYGMMNLAVDWFRSQDITFNQ